MTDFVIVAIVLLLFLGFGIAMGVLAVTGLARRRAARYLEGDHDQRSPPNPPQDDDKPWYDR